MIINNNYFKDEKVSLEKMRKDNLSPEDDTFEVHCSAQGPLGANVYHFKRGLLEWKQRRSYSFVSKKYKVNYEW